MTGGEKRKRGGQFKPPPERKRNNLTFRVVDDLKARLEAAVAVSGRSLSEEIAFRLNRDFNSEATKGEIERDRAKIKALTEASRITALRKAGHQIAREAGNVAVTVAPEMVEAYADAMLRGDTDLLDRSPPVSDEATRKQFVDEVVARIESVLKEAAILKKGAA
jgi:hypothetical protein